MGQFPRLHTLMRIKLIERIERQKLDARPCIEYVTRDKCEDLFHHSVCTRVAILEGYPAQETTSVYQTVINCPAINTDAIECSCNSACFAQSGEGFVPQREDIPEAMSA